MTDEASNPEDPSTATRKRLEYEISGDERASMVVVRAVATLTNTSPMDLDPLFQVIDPEYVDGVTEGQTSGDPSLTFEYSDCHIEVTPNTVRVDPRIE